VKTKGVLHNELAKVIANMGHGDMLVVTDRGFPFPRHNMTACIDVSVGRDLPKFIDVVKVILEELEIESVIIADETEKISPRVFHELQDILSQKTNKDNPIKQKIIPHTEFKHLVLDGALEGQEVKAMVKTGQFTPFANIILVSGVDF